MTATTQTATIYDAQTMTGAQVVIQALVFSLFATLLVRQPKSS